MNWILHRVKIEKRRIRNFWTRVDIREDNDCWPWIGGIDKNGYGVVFWRDSEGAHFTCASRMAYILAYGEPKNFVLHRCDNPPCCNPWHLYDGTQKQNIHDMIQRGRASMWGRNSKIS